MAPWQMLSTSSLVFMLNTWSCKKLVTCHTHSALPTHLSIPLSAEVNEEDETSEEDEDEDGA